MKTALTAMATLGGCAAARWYLDRAARRETEVHGVRLRTLWNEGAAFGLPLPEGMLTLAPAAALGAFWARRKRAPIGTGLILGGGLSNLLERARHGRVYDYVQFPRAPGPLKRYVFNLADFAILAGGVILLARDRKP